MIDRLSARQVADRLDAEDPPVLVDVREDWERQIASIPGSVHIPLGELPARAGELPSDRPLVLHCHHGGRSMQAAQWLTAQGHDRVANLEGGIDDWSLTVDPEIPRYS